VDVSTSELYLAVRGMGLVKHVVLDDPVSCTAGQCRRGRDGSLLTTQLPVQASRQAA
jgi:hypothetical protein